MNKQISLKKGARTAIVSMIVAFLLALFKGIFGLLTANLLLIADAINSASDVLTRFASWFGLFLSQRKKDERFPFGYYKAENIATLIVSASIFYGGYRIFIESYDKLFTLSVFTSNYLLIIPIVSIFTSFFIAIYNLKVGKEIHSQSLIAIGQDSVMDILFSAVVFFGMLFASFKIPYVEGIAGIIVSLLIFRTAYVNAKIAILALMDASPEPILESKIRRIVLGVAGVKDIKHIRLRQSGPFIFGEAHLKVSKTLDVDRSHELSHRIEDSIKHKFPRVEDFIVHIEPYRPERIKVMIPVNDNHGLNSKVMSDFGRAKYFLFVTIQNNDVLSWNFKKNYFVSSDRKAGLLAAKEVLAEKPDYVILSKVGEIAFHVLRDELVDIYTAKEKTAGKVIDKFITNKLKMLDYPTIKG